MRTDDRHLHVRGESVFLDDIAAPAGCLQAAVVYSPVAHGRITRLDVAEALAQEGVEAVLMAADIPGENQIGSIIQDEPLFADGEVHHIGQPVAVVLARTLQQAKQARRHVQLEIDPLEAVVDAREAHARGQLIQPPRTFAIGDVDTAWSLCAHVVTGRADTAAQEHFYIETQGALVIPQEDGTLTVHSSTQGPTAVQKAVSRVIGVPMHAVEVDVRRLGGAFGGKEDQASAWAVMAALGAVITGKAVRLVLDRPDDMVMTGKRHPYSSDFKMGLDGDGNILAYEVSLYQNAGSAADLSTAVLERSLFHCTGSYVVPNVRATAHSCRTNLVPFTAFRGFGGPQSMFVFEAALERASRVMNVPVHELQRRNLLEEGSVLPYGQIVEDCRAGRCWDQADQAFGFTAMVAEADHHNRTHTATKQGVAMMPVCFGISFTNTALNQARALVHVYHDGSVSVSTGAVEMGQGVNRKMRLVVAKTLGIDPERIRVDTTNTGRVANTSPTAASSGSDLNGEAARLASLQILERLRLVAADKFNTSDLTGLDWNELVQAAYWSRTDLSAHAHYATPLINFDKQSETGRPFAYHVYGTAVCTVTLDCLRGTATMDSVKLVHDGGQSIDRDTDRGQVEGGLAQGLGWMLLEDLNFTSDGRLLNDTASKYKVPDIGFGPRTLEVQWLENAPNPRAVMGSKAVGEPPFMYGIGAYFALRHAILAARPDLDPDHVAPLTPERTLMLLAAPKTNPNEEAEV